MFSKFYKVENVFRGIITDFFYSVKYKLEQKNIGRGRCSVSRLFKQSITFMRHGDRGYFGLPFRTIAAKETNSYSDSSHHNS